MRAVPAVDALERRHVAVLAPTRDDDVSLPDPNAVRRVVAPPPAEPDLDPRMALTTARDSDWRVGHRVQITGDVPRRDSSRPQQGKADVRDVLADALAQPPGLECGRLDAGRPGLVLHPSR